MADHQRFGVIDLGTNTFHLLIVAPPQEKGQNFKEIYRHRRFIKLAENGIEHLGDAAYKRGMDALEFFAQKLNEYGTTQVKVIGTAALRTADNGPDFIQEVKSKTGLDIIIIDGNLEASLIYKGVRLSFDQDPGRVLVMDIGGGSVEFILGNGKEPHWAMSFPIGVAVLYSRFHRHEPLKLREQEELQSFLSRTLQPLADALSEYPVKTLVGASGTFDVIRDMHFGDKPSLPCREVPFDKANPLSELVLGLTAEERADLPGIPPQRADLIVVALLLVEYVIDMADFEKLLVSTYAVKEGVVAEHLGIE